MKYTKEELLALINGFFNDNPMIGNTPTAEVRGLIAQYIADNLEKPEVISDDAGRIYPCTKCGVMRTKDEGGTVFTVCDKCWDEEHKKLEARSNDD